MRKDSFLRIPKLYLEINRSKYFLLELFLHKSEYDNEQQQSIYPALIIQQHQTFIRCCIDHVLPLHYIIYRLSIIRQLFQFSNIGKQIRNLLLILSIIMLPPTPRQKQNNRYNQTSWIQLNHCKTQFFMIANIQ